MLDIAWPELVVIGAVALVAIGPKDLPKAMRMIGQWAGKARNMAHDLQRSFEQLQYESEIAEKLKTESPEPPPATSQPETDRDRSGNA
jgi:sec-independent protein translocase protein TatB